VPDPCKFQVRVVLSAVCVHIQERDHKKEEYFSLFEDMLFQFLINIYFALLWPHFFLPWVCEYEEQLEILGVNRYKGRPVF
jgi:hypothetical protein